MTIFGVDYSYSRPDIPAMARDGVKYACRYLRDGSKAGKALSPGEATQLTRAGIAVVSNEETTGMQYRGGYDGGHRDALAAIAAHVACGGPRSRPIYFTPLDHDPASLSSAEWRLLREYAAGVHDVLGDLTGWYGGVRMLDDLKFRGLGSWWWQARGWRTDSGGRLIDTAVEGLAKGYHIQQYQNGVARWGGEVDYDRALVADYGQWGAGATVPAPPLEDEMTEAEFQRLRRAWREDMCALFDMVYNGRKSPTFDDVWADRASNGTAVEGNVSLAALSERLPAPPAP